MDRDPPHRTMERPSPTFFPRPPPPSQYPPPTSQPTYHITPSETFHANREHFVFGGHGRSESLGQPTRAWHPAQGNAIANGHHPQRTPPPQHIHPSPAANGFSQMSLPYDPSRRRSLGGSGSPPQNGQGHHESLPPPPSFQSRHMLPPSPPQMLPSASTLPNSAPRGPPTTSPFPGARDLASFSSNRPGGGMSISSILGNSEERKSQSSPHGPAAAHSPPKPMPPPSPGRARASSMREPFSRGFRDVSTPRNYFGERPSSAVLGHDRVTSEPRREGTAASPIFQHGFRAYHPPQQEQRPTSNGFGPPGRPSSQPIEQAPPRSVEEIIRRDAPGEGHFATFRHFAEPQGLPPRSDAGPRHDTAAFPNGHGHAPPQPERGLFASPQLDRERDRGPPPPMRYPPGSFGTPLAEERPGLFRPAYPPGHEPPRESIEMRHFQDMRRDPSRSSPPLSDLNSFDRSRNGYPERPMTFEEHQRLEAQHRDAQRKESDGSTHRALLNISPELNRKGRNSPLPQAVQGAQPRHVGPGGDNPGIKSEFGRMFSGLGSGVGTATPNAGQSVNGTTTPSRMTPPRQVESGDLVRTAVEMVEEGRSGGKVGGRGKKGGRRSRDEEGANGAGTPDGQRGAKKSKTSHPAHHHHHVHPHHHHHHRHHEPIDNGPSPFNMLRFPANPTPNSSATPNAAHHHHHHHATHAHPGHHHHHPPRSVPPARKQTTTVMSRRLVEDCAKKPRKHLGSQLYTTEISRPPLADMHIDSKIKFSSKMKPIPVFQGKENCTYTVRVPRWYLTMGHNGSQSEEPSYLEEICRRRQLWGTDVYTDDTDVVAAAVHSGWLKGDFGEANNDLRDLCGNESEQDEPREESQSSLAIRPRKPVKVPPEHDAHITLLLLPPLESYPSTTQHHIRSREWKDTHDGMSFVIHRIDFVDEGAANRNVERTAKARKQRLALEEMKKKEAAAGLLMFANANANGSGSAGVQVSA